MPIQDTAEMVELIEKYFLAVGDKACCFEDLKPYLALEGQDLSRLSTFLDSLVLSLVRRYVLAFSFHCLIHGRPLLLNLDGASMFINCDVTTFRNHN
jgi:hypothetical protein